MNEVVFKFCVFLEKLVYTPTFFFAMPIQFTIMPEGHPDEFNNTMLRCSVHT